MTGMDGTAQSLAYPAIAVAFASLFACRTAWDIGQLPGRCRGRERGSSASAALVRDAVTCRIAMGATMAFMLLIMI